MARPVGKIKEVVAGQEVEIPVVDVAALQKEVAALKAKVKDGEEAALNRVCSALKLNVSDVKEREAAKPTSEEVIRCHVPVPVRVNMNVYEGTVEVPLSVFHVIQQAIGDRRMRLLREMTGNNYMLKEISGGGFAPQLVGRVNEHGERI